MTSVKQQLSRDGLLALANAYSDQPGTCLLYSGGDLDSAQCSYLCLFPKKTIVVDSDDQDPWSLPLTFSGKSVPEWVGYFSYEMGAFSDQDKRIPFQPPQIPLALFYSPSVVVEVDHRTGKTIVHSDESLTLEDLYKEAPKTEPFALRIGQFGDEKDLYYEKIARAKDLIYSGDIYQVNLSQKFTLSGQSRPFDLFEKSAHINPAPFMAYLRFSDFAIISTSPERFLSKKGDLLETRPIKGTAARGKTAERDENLKQQLLSSPKDRAELLMITDLMRNDLGKISLPGSVCTEKIWHLESYTNVHHMLSIIRSLALPGLSPIEIIRHCFPGGSITGCPKLRSMEVIHQLEKRSRGIYTGSIGYFSGNQDFDFNIAIRTLLWKKNAVDFHLGGAIVADSHPEAEYLETLQKGESIFSALNMT